MFTMVYDSNMLRDLYDERLQEAARERLAERVERWQKDARPKTTRRGLRAALAVLGIR